MRAVLLHFCATVNPPGSTPPLLLGGEPRVGEALLRKGPRSHLALCNLLALTKHMNAFIQGAVTQGIRPKRTASDALILREGSKYRILVDANGQRTAAGLKYEALAEATLPAEGYDASQNPVRKGDTESIRVRQG